MHSTIASLFFFYLEDKAGGLMGVDAALSSDNVLLVVKGTTNGEDAVLEDCSGITKKEIDGARNDTASVEL